MADDAHPLVEKYQTWSPRSAEIMRRGRRVFPGGDTRASAHFVPYPLVMERGEGCRLYDVDGHELVDFMNNFTSLIHGHAHPAIVEAINEQAPRGSAYAAPSTRQIDFAEMIVDRVPSIEQLRFCSSGSEATLTAIRCARANTGKQKIMKMEGGYHGSYELAEVSLVPRPEERGTLDHPVSVPVDGSIPDSVLGDTVVCPYNEPEMARRLIEEHSSELAAVIVEPVLGAPGMVPATKEFLETLRAETRKHNIVLIFDEVITFRLGTGGVQQELGIEPDLTSMGKIIGGGLPIGAMGGKQELMQIFNPETVNRVHHASTFSGNALSMAAGYAALANFGHAEVSRLGELGERLREGFTHAFAQQGIKGQVMGTGSLSNIILSSASIHDARDALDGVMGAGHINSLLHLCMLRQGINSASRLMYCISTPMNEREVDLAVTALNESLQELRPYIEAERPALLA